MQLKAFFLFFFPLSVFGQSNYFEKIYGTAGNDFSRSVKQIASGSIYVLGNSTSGTIGAEDISLSKLDVHGNELWTIYYGTVNAENAFYLNTTSDGNFVFVAESETNPGDLDILFYEVDTAGGIIWSKSFASPVNESAKYIEQTDDGGYIMCGFQSDLSGHNDILVLKVDAAGDYVWHQTLGRTENEYSDMIHQIGNEYILTADTRSYGAGGYDVILYDLDSLGNEIWSQTYGDSLQNGCQGLLMTSDGNYLSYGETEIYPASAFDFYLEKIDASGASMWRYTYGGTGADAIFSAQEDADGGFICTGYSNSYNGFGPLDLVILKVDQYGTFQWKQTYGGSGIDIGYELIKALDNDGFIITGKTFDGSDQYYLLKLDSNGLLANVPSIPRENFLSEPYPNPADNVVSISYDLPSGKNIQLIICNVVGENLQIINSDSTEEVFNLDLSGYLAGIYFCNLYSDGKRIAVRKMVKK
jgi:hypothetical protein